MRGIGWLVLLACSSACGGHAFPSDPDEGAGGWPSTGGSSAGGSPSSTGGSSGSGAGATGGGSSPDCHTCDTDGDGLNDVDEVAAGLDPFDSDTDDDGLRDGDEDYDHDGVVDAQETDPKAADSDGDSNCDGWFNDDDGDLRSARGCAEGEVLLVDCSAEPSPGRDGRSWATAYAHPQDALDVARKGQQIWLRRGTCRPQHHHESVVTIVPLPISLHGGFLGTEVSFAARVTPPEGTVLDGDLLADDDDDDPLIGRADDSFHVVRIFAGAEVLLDGLEVRHGDALGDTSDTGAGILAGSEVDLWLRDVRCTNNTAVSGGCLAMTAGTLDARRVVFENNLAMLDGGAVFLATTGAELTALEASSNEAAHGGALAFDGAHGTLRDVVLRSNVGTGEGGALFVAGGEWQVENAECTDNEGAVGGAISLRSGHLSLKNALVHSNQSDGPGGAIYSENGFVTLLQAALVGNTSRLPGGGGGALYAAGGSSTLLRVSCVGNAAAAGGCTETDGTLSVHSSELRGNHATNGGGAVRFRGSLAQIVNSPIVGNSGDSGAALELAGSVQLSQLTVAGNHPGEPGASIIGVSNGTARIDNSLLWGTGPNDTSLVVTGGSGALLGEGNCAPEPLAGLCRAAALLTSSPLACSADAGDCPAREENPCVDAGSDERATAIGFDSDELSTTTIDLDEGAIDAGYHYATDEVRITSFTATATTVSYETVNASSCIVVSVSDSEPSSYQVLAAEALAAGKLSHGVPEGSLHLVCWDASGRPKAAALEMGAKDSQWFDRW